MCACLLLGMVPLNRKSKAMFISRYQIWSSYYQWWQQSGCWVYHFPREKFHIHSGGGNISQF